MNPLCTRSSRTIMRPISIYSEKVRLCSTPKPPEVRLPSVPKTPRVSIRQQILKNAALFSHSYHEHSFSLQSLPNAPVMPDFVIENYSHLLTEEEKYEIKTYPDIYYIRQSMPAKNSTLNLKSEYFPFVEGDHVRYQFQQMSELGRGAFGSVLKCYDHKTKTIVALKFIKDTPKMQKQTRQELESLDVLQSGGHSSDSHVIHFYECFIFRGFYVFVFELLGSDMHSTLKFNNFNGILMEQVQTVARDVAKALRYSHSKGIIHCDIRPHNIVWVTYRRKEAKLIDFGCSHRAKEMQSMYVQSRCYRAPEVILGFPVTTKVDIWSYACVIAELATGKLLFGGHTEEEQLMLYASVIGSPPQSLLDDSPNAKRIYDGTGRVKKVLQSKRIAPNAKSLKKILNSSEVFTSFIQSCLVWNPEERPSADELLSHPFLTTKISEMC